MSTSHRVFSSEFFDYLHNYLDRMESISVEGLNEFTAEMDERLEKLEGELDDFESKLIVRVMEALDSSEESPLYFGYNKIVGDPDAANSFEIEDDLRYWISSAPSETHIDLEDVDKFNQDNIHKMIRVKE